MVRRRVDPGYIPEQRIERAACQLIGRYKAKYGSDTEDIIPADAILESLLGLTLEFDDLNSKHSLSDVLGATWVGARTVRIDSSLDPDRFPEKTGRFFFTVAHEIGHWELHSPLFLRDQNQATLLTEGTEPTILCRSSMKKEPMEHQADLFASYLLMPTDRVFAAWDRLRGGRKPYLAVHEIRELSERWDDPNPTVEIAKRMARQFDVSGQAMQIRLIKLGLIQTKTPAPDLFTAAGL